MTKEKVSILVRSTVHFFSASVFPSIIGVAVDCLFRNPCWDSLVFSNFVSISCSSILLMVSEYIVVYKSKHYPCASVGFSISISLVVFHSVTKYSSTYSWSYSSTLYILLVIFCNLYSDLWRFEIHPQSLLRLHAFTSSLNIFFRLGSNSSIRARFTFHPPGVLRILLCVPIFFSSRGESWSNSLY